VSICLRSDDNQLMPIVKEHNTCNASITKSGFLVYVHKMNFNNVSSTVAENRSLPMQVSSESQGLKAHKSRQGCLNSGG
jgi:hypothetical protein